VPNLAREHFYPAHEQGLGNEILPPSNEKVNNLQVAILSDETPCPFLHFCLLTIRYLIYPLGYVLLMPYGYKQSHISHTPYPPIGVGPTLPQGPKTQTPHQKY